jgi:uncharacterized protein (DUF2062 family)
MFVPHFAVCLRSMIHPSGRRLHFSIGIFIAFSPFLGLHTIMATLIAFAFRFNKIAIYTGTFINNPILTLVPIIVISYAVGAFILGRPLSIPDEGVALLKEPHLFTRDYYRRLFVQSWNDVVWPFCDRRVGPVGSLFTTCISANIVGLAET